MKINGQNYDQKELLEWDEVRKIVQLPIKFNNYFSIITGIEDIGYANGEYVAMKISNSDISKADIIFGAVHNVDEINYKNLLLNYTNAFVLMIGS